MRKILLVLIAILLIPAPAHAGFWANHKVKAAHQRQVKADYNEVKSVLDKQLAMSNKYDFEGLKTLYADNFVNCDGFNKEVYFKLVKDTWDTYKDITYTAQVQNVYYNGSYAQVQVYETAMATTIDSEDNISMRGELISAADCIYYLGRCV